MDVFRISKTYIPPVHPAEMEWLAAFVSCIEWMEEGFPDLAGQAKRNAERRLEEKALRVKKASRNSSSRVQSKDKGFVLHEV